MAFYIVLESDGVSRIQLEDGTGSILLEQQGGFTATQRRTSGFMAVRVGSRAALSILVAAILLWPS